jgi:hypothetical protein
MYSRTTNHNTASYLYIGPDPYGRHSSAKEIPVDTAPSSDIHSSSRTSCNPHGNNTIYLPKSVLNLFCNPLAHHRSTRINLTGTSTTLVVADTDATNHMLPDKLAFILYTPVSGRQVRMGNNSFAPIARKGLAIISLNSKKFLICNCLHVPDLCNPLYSLRAHQRQRGRGHSGMHGLGMHVFLPISSSKSTQLLIAISITNLWDAY